MLNRMLMVGAIALTLAFGATTAQAQAVCGTQVSTLWAGQHIDVGTLTVSNDDTNLYLTFELDAPWWLTEVHVYVDDTEPLSRLIPGKAPYKSGDISYEYSYEMTISLEDLDFDVECGEAASSSALWIQAHAAVVRYDANYQIVKGESAYGGDVNKPQKGAWYGNVLYTLQCCDTGDPVDECLKSAAWGGNLPGEATNQGQGQWWFYYDNAVGGVQTLWADQDQETAAGTVQVVGNTITIQLNPGWYLRDVKEPVKIKGYDDLPATRPSPGSLDDYKGDDLIIPMSAVLDYFVIHLDVEFCE